VALKASKILTVIRMRASQGQVTRPRNQVIDHCPRFCVVA
jgi:hypothetical protein